MYKFRRDERCNGQRVILYWHGRNTIWTDGRKTRNNHVHGTIRGRKGGRSVVRYLRSIERSALPLFKHHLTVWRRWWTFFSFRRLANVVTSFGCSRRASLYDRSASSNLLLMWSMAPRLLWLAASCENQHTFCDYYKIYITNAKPNNTEVQPSYRCWTVRGCICRL